MKLRRIINRLLVRKVKVKKVKLGAYADTARGLGTHPRDISPGASGGKEPITPRHRARVPRTRIIHLKHLKHLKHLFIAQLVKLHRTFETFETFETFICSPVGEAT